MADTKLSALSLGTSAPEYVYGIQSGNSRKYHAKQVVNVKDFGAVGNGSTDDHDAIQAAIDAAFGAMPGSPNGQANPELNKELYFPPGNYACNSPLLIVDTKGAKIYGAGDGTSQIFFQAQGNEGCTLGPDLDVTPLFEMDGCSDIEISEISIACSRNQTLLPYSSYLTTAGTASGFTLTFAAAAKAQAGALVYSYSAPGDITNGTRVVSNTGGSVVLDTAVASAVGSGDRIFFVTSNVGFYLFESGGNGVSGHITWRNCHFSNWGSGILAAGTTGCANCTLFNIQFNNCGLAGLRLENPEALKWVVYGGGASQTAMASTYRMPLGAANQGNHGACYSIVSGQVSLMTNMSPSVDPVGTADPELSVEGGWGVINAGGHPLAIFGARFECIRAIATVGGPMSITGAVFANANATVGVREMDASFGGSITCTACHFGPSGTISPEGWICELGTSGVLVLRECQFTDDTDDCAISGSSNAKVSILNLDNQGPTIANLFASFTAPGGVLDLTPTIHNVTFATLPTANAKYKGLKGVITDCNTTTYNANAAGGGSSIVPVFCNGTNWKVG